MYFFLDLSNRWSFFSTSWVITINMFSLFLFVMLKCIVKYDFQKLLIEYLKDGVFPSKCEWSSMIKIKIHNYEENNWFDKISNWSELSQYFKNHSCLEEHIFIKICTNGQYKSECLNLLNVVCAAIKASKCSLCGKNTTDIFNHLIINCPVTQNERNYIFIEIVNILTPTKPWFNFMSTWIKWYSQCW